MTWLLSVKTDKPKNVLSSRDHERSVLRGRSYTDRATDKNVDSWPKMIPVWK